MAPAKIKTRRKTLGIAPTQEQLDNISTIIIYSPIPVLMVWTVAGWGQYPR